MTVVVLMCDAGVLPVSAVGAQDSLPKESNWAWVYTAALFDKWQAETGRATVTVEGTKFAAKLFDAEHPTLVLFTLTGTVNGEEVRVRVVREGSDSSPADYSGKIVTRRFTGFADYTGVQTLLLFDSAQHQLGLTRTLRR
jgi:hypothetical protein